jgi:hypothetical protein
LGASKQKTPSVPAKMRDAAVEVAAGPLLKDFYALSEKTILERILAHPTPRKLIRQLPSGDFFWLVKKMGEEGSLQLLRLASTDQWQYALDLELWRNDRLDLEEAASWLRLLQWADPGRLTRWLLTDGQALVYYYLFKNIQVEIRDEDETYDLEDGFVTLDGLFYIKVIDPDRKETIETMLRSMADADFVKYQSLLSALAGVIPAELEEDMYRMKNVRLAEHGFLPAEEAMTVYAPLEPGSLVSGERTKGVDDQRRDEGILDLAPYSPLLLVEGKHLLTKTVSGSRDGRFLHRFRLEFAGLCNQILSADGLPTHDMDVLRKACQKSVGYMNVVLERLCGDDSASAEAIVRQNSLISLFRAGFGLALRLKWEVDRWLGQSWFRQAGFGFDFWGEAWGYPLSGLAAKRPVYYDMETGGGKYRDFEHDSELTEARTILHRVMGLDRLLAELTAPHPLDPADGTWEHATFHSLMFTLWARRMLDLPPSLKGISLKEARRFFRFLRSGDKAPPYRMAAYETVFAEAFMAPAAEWVPEDAATLKEALSVIWEGFCREYERVPLNALDPRFSPYIAIRPSP